MMGQMWTPSGARVWGEALMSDVIVVVAPRADESAWRAVAAGRRD